MKMTRFDQAIADAIAPLKEEIVELRAIVRAKNDKNVDTNENKDDNKN
jgi:hypothetical protein